SAQPHPGVTVGAPRLPVLTPLSRLVPAGERVAVDWPNAFLLPCRRPASLADGVTYPVNYRFAEAADMSGIAAGEFDQANGGPYAPLHALATERQFPTYLRGDSVEEPVHIARLGYVDPPLTGVHVQPGQDTDH